MHCVSTYPMKESDANLNVIRTLKDKYNCNVGYSGHETGIAVSIGASAMGISSLERHITLDRSMYGSDQSASLEPNGLRMLLGSVRKVEQAMGDGIKKILDAEIPIGEKLREHIPMTNLRKIIKAEIEDSINIKKNLLETDSIMDSLDVMINLCIETIKIKAKLFSLEMEEVLQILSISQLNLFRDLGLTEILYPQLPCNK